MMWFLIYYIICVVISAVGFGYLEGENLLKNKDLKLFFGVIVLLAWFVVPALLVAGVVWVTIQLIQSVFYNPLIALAKMGTKISELQEKKKENGKKSNKKEGK